jgi:hypothetical protein
VVLRDDYDKHSPGNEAVRHTAQVKFSLSDTCGNCVVPTTRESERNTEQVVFVYPLKEVARLCRLLSLTVVYSTLSQSYSHTNFPHPTLQIPSANAHTEPYIDHLGLLRCLAFALFADSPWGCMRSLCL